MFPDDWRTTADVIRETGERGLGGTSGRKGDKDTWWWNEELQNEQRKRLKKKKRDTERTEERRQEDREMQIRRRFRWRRPN